jgi:hypothetical protein
MKTAKEPQEPQGALVTRYQMAVTAERLIRVVGDLNSD